MYCTSDSWEALVIEHSATPENLPAPYSTEITVKCVAGYTLTSALTVTCETSGEFKYTGDKPTCQSGVYNNNNILVITVLVTML